MAKLRGWISSLCVAAVANTCCFYAVLKYVGYYAELPIHLPKEMEDRIVTGMHETSVSQSEWVKGRQTRKHHSQAHMHETRVGKG